MSSAQITAQFIQGGRGRIFGLQRRPAAVAAGRAVLIVPPFAEEMNKSRRVCTEVSNALTQRGVATVMVDLHGTGDSDADFADADWSIWHEDLVRAAQWSAQSGWIVDSLFCIRTGCQLGVDLINGGLPVRTTLFVQPVPDGARYLAQFLRLRIAASLMSEGERETVGSLQQRLRQGESVEVAGYELSARLAAQLEEKNLAQSVDVRVGALHWIEIGRSPDAPLPTPVEQAIAALREKGVDVKTHALPGDPFWQSTEIVTNPQLVELAAGLLTNAP